MKRGFGLPESHPHDWNVDGNCRTCGANYYRLTSGICTCSAFDPPFERCPSCEGVRSRLHVDRSDGVSVASIKREDASAREGGDVAELAHLLLDVGRWLPLERAMTLNLAEGTDLGLAYERGWNSCMDEIEGVLRQYLARPEVAP